MAPVKSMGELGLVEIRQFYRVWWHRFIRRVTTEVKHKNKIVYFDSRTKVWVGQL